MIQDLFRWIILVKVAPITARLSPAMLYAVSFIIGSIQYLLYGRARKAIREGFRKDMNLTGVKLESAVRASICNHLLYDMELAVYPRIDGKFVDRHITFTGSGWEHIQKNKDKRFLLLTFHFGPNQIIIPAFPLKGISFTQLAVPPSYWDNLVGAGKMLREVNRQRTSCLENTGAEFVYLSEGVASLRKVMKTEKSGLMCIAMDGRMGDLRERPFLKGKMEITMGGLNLAARLNIPVIPVFVVRRRSGYEVMLTGPFDVTGDNKETVSENILCQFEKVAIQNPEHYGWMYYAKAVGS